MFWLTELINMNSLALTDPCKHLSRYFIPNHLAHDFILSGISVFQLEDDHISLMISHSSESWGWDRDASIAACDCMPISMYAEHTNLDKRVEAEHTWQFYISYHHIPWQCPLGSWSKLEERGTSGCSVTLTVVVVQRVSAYITALNLTFF